MLDCPGLFWTIINYHEQNLSLSLKILQGVITAGDSWFDYLEVVWSVDAW